MTAYPRLKLENVTKYFGQGAKRIKAVDDVSFTLAENEFVSLVGASGCGKSTILSIIAGLQDCDEGVVLVDGMPIYGPGRDRGVVFQSYSLMPWLTALQNVEFALHAAGIRRKEAREIALEHLKLVKLEKFQDRYPSELSGGMKQRVAIARALSYRPKILLMDEPFGALDALTRSHMHELLTSIWEEHRLSVLFITHDVDEAVFLSDRVMVMSNQPGRIKLTVPITLPRPRTADTMTTDAFRDAHWTVLSAIREESMKIADKEGMAAS
ncbi:ABC transporter ATP-binding protein [Methyloligella sp. 2.7D]|uniref:ABC transporter ATP-binding protein n=1 Tax=unclassified Methyloligella TaxID=2625955 RepID=UPI00157BC269|nr:ABC transporter ATP-binding protein [Methyloligella sp. GL2]QKP78213.1 ABC transporter ATP-binding protein [Methyloligella sp. GL2]